MSSLTRHTIEKYNITSQLYFVLELKKIVNQSINSILFHFSME